MKKFVFSRGALFTALLAASCLVFIGGCGKSGMPVPKKTQDMFAITEPGIAVIGNCFAARGTVTGAIANVDTVMIEIAPILSYDDCPGCPFVPQEYSEFSASGIQLDQETGQFMLSFCPTVSAPMYRWRLVGKNVFLGLPHATTTPQVVVVHPQEKN